MPAKQNSRKYLFATILMISFSMDSHAKTCEGDNPQTWNDCVGAVTVSDVATYGPRALYVGQFKAGKLNGLGSLEGTIESASKAF